MSSSKSCAALDGADGDEDEKLLQRLNKRFDEQISRRLETNKNIVDCNDHDQNDRPKSLSASLRLYSDELRLAMDDLETICSEHNAPRGVELVEKIRIMVHNEIRQSLSYIESGYQSGFHSLLKEAEKNRQLDTAHNTPTSSHPSMDNELAASPIGAVTRASHSSISVTEYIAADRDTSRSSALAESQAHDEKGSHEIAIMRETAEAYAIGVEVTAEMKRQQEATRSKLAHPHVSMQEALSMTTALFAESLATLLMCEVVRIYLFDEHHNLHCCACYPFHALQGDPTHATYTEIMLAKDLHSTVCDRCFAVNGSGPDYRYLTEQDLRLVAKEQRARGWASMQSCLIFPILSSAGASHSFGMIHAVNKVCTPAGQPNTFTAQDEVMLSISTRVLGCILTRYPVPYFTLRVGEALRRAIFPCEDTAQLDDHLPYRVIDDDVADAAVVANRAIASHCPVLIYRAPISSIYETRVHHVRKKKFAHLLESDTTLSSMEFNMLLTHQSWEEGLKENALMHKKCRAFHDELQACRLLLRNLLDGLAVTRVMESMSEVAEYLRKLELFGRSEGTEMIMECTNHALLECSQRQRRQRYDTNSGCDNTGTSNTDCAIHDSEGPNHSSLSRVQREASCLADSTDAHPVAHATQSASQDLELMTKGHTHGTQSIDTHSICPSRLDKDDAHRAGAEKRVAKVKLPLVARECACEPLSRQPKSRMSRTKGLFTDAASSKPSIQTGDNAGARDGNDDNEKGYIHGTSRVAAPSSRTASPKTPSPTYTSSSLSSTGLQHAAHATVGVNTLASSADATSSAVSLRGTRRRRQQRDRAVDELATVQDDRPLPHTVGVDGLLADDLSTMIFRQSQKAYLNIGQMHYDGPEGVCMYSSDPAQKRDQMHMCNMLTAQPVNFAGAVRSRPDSVSQRRKVYNSRRDHNVAHAGDAPSSVHVHASSSYQTPNISMVPSKKMTTSNGLHARALPRSVVAATKPAHHTMFEMAQLRPFLLK